MKSLTAVFQTAGASSLPAINASGRIARHPHHRGDGENAEMKMYLSKLKDLVPFMPKNRKLSKLEIIQHVIDYICDLQSELETHPEIGNFDATSALNFVANAQQQQNDDDDDDDDNNDNDNGNDDEERLSERLSAGGAAEQLFQQQHQQQQLQHSSPASRQPLVDRQTPNTILPESASFATAATAIPMQPYHHHHHHQQQLQQQQQLSLATAHSAQTQSAEKDSSRQPC